MGVRQMEITNKFDNQLTGVAGDGGSTGVIVNTGQFGTSGSFWDFGPENDEPGDCDEHNHDHIPATGGAPRRRTRSSATDSTRSWARC